MSGLVEISIEGGIARIFLNRPQKSNALDSGCLDELVSCLAGIRTEKNIRVAVLAGRGKAFCGGADVKELAGLTHQNASEFVSKIHAACSAIRSLPIPVVASLHGACIGAGLEIAAACDLRLAAEGTKFAMPEVRLGIPSVVEAALLPRLMGSGRAAWLVLTGEPIDARRAFEWGLVEEVTADLAASTERCLKSLLAGDARALAMQKELVQIWDEAPLSQSIAVSLEQFARAYAPPSPRKLRR